jgi:hypothetical protein
MLLLLYARDCSWKRRCNAELRKNREFKNSLRKRKKETLMLLKMRLGKKYTRSK